MIICQKCGTPFDESYGICPVCGTKSEAPQPAPQPAYSVPMPKPSPYPGIGGEKPPAPKKSKSKSKLIVILIIVCAAVIAGTAAAILLFSQADHTGALEEQISLGEKYLTEENYDEAIKALKKAIEIDPNNPDLYLRLSEAYAGKGDCDHAIETIESALAKMNNDALQARLEELKKEKNYRELMEKGDQALTKMEYHSAVVFFEQAADIKPEEVQPYLSSADGYLGENDYCQAIQILDKGYEATHSEDISLKLDNIYENIDYTAYITTIPLKGKLYSKEKEYDLPQLSVSDSADAEEINQEIQDLFALSSSGEIIRVPSYEVHGFKGILSLTVTSDLGGISLIRHHCFHFSLHTKKQLSSSELLALTGITEEDLSKNLNSFLAFSYCKISRHETDSSGKVTQKGKDASYIKETYPNAFGSGYDQYVSSNKDLPSDARKKYLGEDGTLYLSVGNGLADYIETFVSYEEFLEPAAAEESEEASSDTASGTWKDAYGELLFTFLEENNSLVENGSAKFELLDLDSDGIPELFISQGTMHILQCICYSCQDGKADEIARGTYGVIKVCQEKGLLYSESGGMGGWTYTYRQKTAEGCVVYKTLSATGGMAGMEMKYHIDDKEVTQAEYEAEKAALDALSWYDAGRKTDFSAANIAAELDKW